MGAGPRGANQDPGQVNKPYSREENKGPAFGLPRESERKTSFVEIKRLKRSGADRPGRRATSRVLPLGQLNAHLSRINPMGLNGARQR